MAGAGAPPELSERFDDGTMEANGEATGFDAYCCAGWLVCQKSGDRAAEDQRRYREQRTAPAEATDQPDGTGPSNEQGKAIAPDVTCEGHALATFRESLDTPCVDHDVLASRQECDRHCRHKELDWRMNRIGGRQKDAGGSEKRLDRHQPASTSSEQSQPAWWARLIQDRRPQKLQSVGEPDIRGQADRRKRGAALCQPLTEREARERQRKPGKEAERAHQKQPMIAPRAGRLWTIWSG